MGFGPLGSQARALLCVAQCSVVLLQREEDARAVGVVDGLRRIECERLPIQRRRVVQPTRFEGVVALRLDPFGRALVGVGDGRRRCRRRRDSSSGRFARVLL